MQSLGVLVSTEVLRAMPTVLGREYTPDDPIGLCGPRHPSYVDGVLGFMDQIVW